MRRLYRGQHRSDTGVRVSQVVTEILKSAGPSGSTQERLAHRSGYPVYRVVVALETLKLDDLVEIGAWTPDGDPVWRLTA